jgi:hypothetical protein
VNRDSGTAVANKVMHRITSGVRQPLDELKDPLLPPWLKFPDIPPGSIGWRMGYG